MSHRKSKAQLSWGMRPLEVLEDVLQVVVGKGEVQGSQSSVQGLVQEEVQDVAGKMELQELVQEELPGRWVSIF